MKQRMHPKIKGIAMTKAAKRNDHKAKPII
jgi:hypothetical protein